MLEPAAPLPELLAPGHIVVEEALLLQLDVAPGGRIKLGTREFTISGLVRREPAPGDRRGVFVVITPEGERRHHEAFEAHLPVIRREFGENNQRTALYTENLANAYYRQQD